MQHLTIAVVTVAISLMTGCGGRSVDQSFARLELQRSDGVFGALERGTMTQAVVERSADGTLTMTAKVRGTERTTTQQCAACLVDLPLGPVVLDKEKALTLTALVAAVPEPSCEQVPNLECDPPVFENLIIDGTTFSTECCGHLNQDFADAARAVITFLDALVPPR